MIELYIFPDDEIYDSENDKGPPSNKSDDYVLIDENTPMAVLTDQLTYSQAKEVLKRFFGE